jgi:small GTP-binding protein
MIKKKICMLGSFAVGKTSLVQRFVRSVFSEKYFTTVGVRIDQKTVNVDGRDVLLMLWDIHGEDDFQKVKASYLYGMSGFLLVADGTRKATLDVAVGLKKLCDSTVGPVPCMLLLNKSDMADRWAISQDRLAEIEKDGLKVVRTSALTGDGVEDAFLALTKSMVG